VSLIADSLKKAQRERQQDRERLADNILRTSIVPELSRVSKSTLLLVLVPAALAAVWFALRTPEPEGMIAKEPVPSQNQPSAPQPEPEMAAVTQMEREEPPASGEDEQTAGPLDSTEMAWVKELDNAEIQVSKPGSGQKTGSPKVEKAVIQSPSKKKKTSGDTPSGDTQTESTSTPVKVKAPSSSQIQKPVVVDYKPFVKTESPLEKVAALTENLETSAQTEPPVQPEPESSVEPEPPIQVSQEVPVTAIEPKKEKAQPESPVTIVVEPESTGTMEPQMTGGSGEMQEGEDTITVVPNSKDMEGMRGNPLAGADRRNLDDKTRYFNIASYHHRRKEFFESLKYYDKALKLDPHNARIHNNRALIYKEMGRGRDAINELLQAVRIDPSYVKAYNNLGLMYFLYGDTLSAIRHFEKATQIDPRNTESLNNLAILYKQQHQTQRAEMLYRKVINLDPEQPEGYYNLALLYEQSGRISDAVRYYRRFVELARSSRPGLAMKVRGHIRKLE